MMIVMKPGASNGEIQHVIDRIESTGARSHVSPGETLTVIGAIGDTEHDEKVANLGLEEEPGVDRVVPIAKPYKLASTQLSETGSSVFEIGGRKVGGSHFAMMAGPCTVESREQTVDTAKFMKDQDLEVTMYRGGAYKPRTGPYSFMGLGRDGLKLLQEAKDATGYPIVTELMDTRELDPILEVADVIQVGARNMQNYTLLTELGKAGRPVLLKRGLSATLDELLLAAEYILKEGNANVMLCERGIRTFENAYRFTLDLLAIPVLQERTHLPVIVDPSHAAGKRHLVEPMALAAAAAGADGIIVETHPVPEEAICDGPQAIRLSDFPGFVKKVSAAAALNGKTISV